MVTSAGPTSTRPGSRPRGRPSWPKSCRSGLEPGRSGQQPSPFNERGQGWGDDRRHSSRRPCDAVAAAASSDNLVTVGLKPTFPSTGLGYIHAPGRLSRGTLRVKRFIEKPNAASARRFVREGGYFWNLAWFSWRLSTFIDELGRHDSRHLATIRV